MLISDPWCIDGSLHAALNRRDSLDITFCLICQIDLVHSCGGKHTTLNTEKS